mgnify:CR=1 FL=1
MSTVHCGSLGRIGDTQTLGDDIGKRRSRQVNSSFPPLEGMRRVRKAVGMGGKRGAGKGGGGGGGVGLV